MFLTPVRQATFAPALQIVIERAPFKRNAVVIETLPSGMQRKARVVTCYFDDSMGASGEWVAYLKFYPMVQDDSGEWVQDTTRVMYTWTSPRVLEGSK